MGSLPLRENNFWSSLKCSLTVFSLATSLIIWLHWLTSSFTVKHFWHTILFLIQLSCSLSKGMATLAQEWSFKVKSLRTYTHWRRYKSTSLWTRFVTKKRRPLIPVRKAKRLPGTLTVIVDSQPPTTGKCKKLLALSPTNEILNSQSILMYSSVITIETKAKMIH